MTGEAGLCGVRGLTVVFAVAGVFAVGDVAAVRVGAFVGTAVVASGLGDVDGVGVGDSDGWPGSAPTTIAGRGSAAAGAPELSAAIPSAQVPTPSVPETAQAIADFDSGMVLPSSRSG
ncbi:MAG: hypothetical protein AAGC63_10075 [Propionicimonas sp.]|nr:hypothetical protein [Propionicimonas sp.]